MTKCNFEDCEKPIAPADGTFCVIHSHKLATPSSSMAAARAMKTPRSAQAAANGINTSVDFAAFMGGLMSDVVEGRVDPDAAVAAVQAGNALLKVVEMRLRHGFKDEALQLGEAKGGIVDPQHLKLNRGK